MRNRTFTHLVAVLVAAVASSGCGSDTGRARVEFDVEVAGLAPQGRNDHGYTITLTSARLTLAELAFFEGDPLFAWSRLGELFVSTAHAHPGHYTPGESLADLTGGHTFDLLGAPQTWGRAVGVTGRYASAEITVGDGRGPALVLEGEATGPEGTTAFVARLEEGADLAGVAFGAEVRPSIDRIRMNVDLQAILQWVDFSRLDTMGGTRAELAAGSQPFNAFQRGAIRTDAYTFEQMTLEEGD